MERDFASQISGAEAAALTQELTDELRLLFRQANVSPDLIYAFAKTGKLVAGDNRDRLSPAEMREWKRTLGAYRRRAEADSRTIELCYSLHHERGRSDLSRKRRFAASELGVAVLNALDEEISSFAMEGAFLNAWLELHENSVNPVPGSQEEEKIGRNRPSCSFNPKLPHFVGHCRARSGDRHVAHG